jgi:hypothetical protein
MTTLVPLTRSQKLALADKPLKDVATELLGEIPQEEAGTDFPGLPKALTATAEIRSALKVLSSTFNKVTVAERRTMKPEEIGSIGVEMEAIKAVGKLLGEREEALKEYVKTHQDVEAEEQGRAFPKDVVRGGKTIAEATSRDKDGHYILAAKGEAVDTEIPGTTLRFSMQLSSGRTTENLGAIAEMFENGEIDEAAYKAMTVVRRVPTAEKVRAYVLKTGRTDILGKIVKKGRDGSALYLRALKKR